MLIALIMAIGLYGFCGCGQSASANVKTTGDVAVEQDPKNKSIEGEGNKGKISQKNVTNNPWPMFFIVLGFVIENIMIIAYILWSKRYPEIGRR